LALHGVLDANAVVQGPRATPDFDLRADVRGVGARQAGELSLDGHVHAHVHRGVLQTDGWAAGSGIVRVDFQGELPIQAIATQPSNAPVQFEARLAQLDLARALRDRTYLRGMLDRSLQADLAVTQLPLERLSRSGFLPPGSTGTVSLSARLGGTPRDPTLDMNTTGNDVTIGRLHALAFQGALAIKDKVQATLGAQSQGDVVARAEMAASLSGGELMEV